MVDVNNKGYTSRPRYSWPSKVFLVLIFVALLSLFRFFDFGLTGSLVYEPDQVVDAVVEFDSAVWVSGSNVVVSVDDQEYVRSIAVFFEEDPDDVVFDNSTVFGWNSDLSVGLDEFNLQFDSGEYLVKVDVVYEDVVVASQNLTISVLGEEVDEENAETTFQGFSGDFDFTSFTIPDMEFITSAVPACAMAVNEDINFTADLTCGTPIALMVNASDIVIDCHGYNLTDNGASNAGIMIDNNSNVTIKNCVINQFPIGIYIYPDNATDIAQDNIIINNTIISNIGGVPIAIGEAGGGNAVGNIVTRNNLSSNFASIVLFGNSVADVGLNNFLSGANLVFGGSADDFCLSDSDNRIYDSFGNYFHPSIPLANRTIGNCGILVNPFNGTLPVQCGARVIGDLRLRYSPFNATGGTYCSGPGRTLIVNSNNIEIEGDNSFSIKGDDVGIFVDGYENILLKNLFIFNYTKAVWINNSNNINTTNLGVLLPGSIIIQNSNVTLNSTYLGNINSFVNYPLIELNDSSVFDTQGHIISDVNLISVDSVGEPLLNRSASLFFSLFGNSPLRNGEPCPSSICTNFRYGTLFGLFTGTLFNVTQFTNYSVSTVNVTCGDVINQSVILSGDLLNATNGTICPNDGLIVNASDITIDCNNYSIIGRFLGKGIIVKNKTNITIINCVIRNFTRGIYLQSTNDSFILSNDVIDNSLIGVRLLDSYRNILSRNYGFADLPGLNGATGISLRNSSFNNLTSNSMYNFSLFGIFSAFGTNNRFLSNTASNVVNGSGIYLANTTSNTLVNNTAENNAIGFNLAILANSNILINNTADDNMISPLIPFNLSGYGFLISASAFNYLEGNLAGSNEKYGFDIFASANNTLVSNKAVANEISGFYMLGAVFNNLTLNGVRSNNDDTAGFWLQASFLNNLDSNRVQADTIGFFLNLSLGNVLTSNLADMCNGSYSILDSDFNNFTNNTANDFFKGGGFVFFNSNNNLNNGNTIQGGENRGVIIFNSVSNSFYNNFVTNNANDGFKLVNSNNSIFVSNLVSMGDEDGISLQSSNNNTFSDNIVSGHTGNTGFILDNSSDNNTINDSFVFLNNIGIEIYGKDNFIFNNYFAANTDNDSIDNSVGSNDWNTTNQTGPNIINGSNIGGNYHSDYTNCVAGSDGFCTLPYTIPGTASNIDDLPLAGVDLDGDGFISTLDCDDNNSEKRPVYPGVITLVDTNLTLCPNPFGGDYFDVHLVFNKSNIYVDCNNEVLDTSHILTNKANTTVRNCRMINSNITVRDTNTGVRIEDNVISGCPPSSAGIFLISSSGDFIINNTIFNCDIGISMLLVNNTLIELNNLTNNGNGVTSSFGNNNIYRSNFATLNKGGILVYHDRNYSITNNQVWNNNKSTFLNRGIALYGPFNDCNIINNNLIYNNTPGFGMFVRDLDSNTCSIENNQIYNNEVGVLIDDSANFTFTDNFVFSNTELGLNITNSTDVLIYNNIFNNTNSTNGEVYDDTGNNTWNTAKTKATNIMGGRFLGGNFYSDYNGTDNNRDDLGDTPHLIQPGLVNDSWPLVFPSPVKPGTGANRGGGGGGSGSSASGPSKYIITITELGTFGTYYIVHEYELISSVTNKHFDFSLDRVTRGEVDITINRRSFHLLQGKEIEEDVDGDGKKDLSFRLDNTIYNRAELTMRALYSAPTAVIPKPKEPEPEPVVEEPIPTGRIIKEEQEIEPYRPAPIIEKPSLFETMTSNLGVILLILVIILIGGMVGLFFLKKSKKVTKTVSDALRKLSTIKDYIVKYKASGYTDDQIKAQLMKYFSKDLVNKGFEEMKTLPKLEEYIDQCRTQGYLDDQIKSQLGKYYPQKLVQKGFQEMETIPKIKDYISYYRDTGFTDEQIQSHLEKYYPKDVVQKSFKK